MIKSDLKQLANILKIPFSGTNQPVNGISIDTRTLKPGEVFIAIQGKQYDAHDFISTAFSKGASGAIAHRNLSGMYSGAILQVKNTQQALSHLAQYHRENFKKPLIAITGSCGKTTTTRLLATVLSQQGKTLRSQKSFNNAIGVPLTLLALDESYQYAVIEIGANHPGEITGLTQIAKPSIAIITNAGSAHLEGFKTQAGIAKAKGEIIEHLSQKDLAILNADDAYFHYWKSLSSASQLSFGLQPGADIHAEAIQIMPQGTQFRLNTPSGSIEIKLALAGKHAIMNALAAASAAYALNCSLALLKKGLEIAKPIAGRLTPYPGLANSLILDDSYNANPHACFAALDVLAKYTGKTLFILGDMAELGQTSQEAHQQIGYQAKEKHIDILLGFGPLSAHAVQAFGPTGKHFTDKTKLTHYVKSLLDKQTTVLIKGSRTTHMETITKALIHPKIKENHLC